MVCIGYLLVLLVSCLQLHHKYPHSLVMEVAVIDAGVWEEGGRIGSVSVMDSVAMKEGGRVGLVALSWEGGMGGLVWSRTPHLKGWEGTQCISAVSPETDAGYLVIFGCISSPSLDPRTSSCRTPSS